MNILEKWNAFTPLTEEERVLLNKRMHHKPNETSDYDTNPCFCENNFWINTIEMEYFKLMPFCNLCPGKNHLTFNTCCSNFIRELFYKYVDDDTLVISSDCEHPTVKECLKNCKNTLILSQHNDIRRFNLNKIANSIINYKKIFVYIIGMRNDTGEITPQSFMLALKDLLNTKEHIIVLDDVQGMFFIPRDYSIYDYVLGTGHVAVPNFDLGIMISKKPYPGINAINWAKAYLEVLKIVLKRLKKLYLFRNYCNEYFKSFCIKYPPSQALAAPHIFYLQKPKAKVTPEVSLSIEKVHTLIMPNTTQIGGIRMRALGFITAPETLKKAIQIFNYVLETNYIDEKVLLEIIND